MTKKKETVGRAFPDDPSTWPPGPVVTLEAPHTDARGFIQPILERHMRSALVIRSAKGSLRANHYHKTDWHFCYLVSGSMEYFHRPANSKAKPERIVVKAGQMVFSPPMVDHAMRFLEDSDMVVLSRNPRDPGAYEDDLVRVDLAH